MALTWPKAASLQYLPGDGGEGWGGGVACSPNN